MKRAMVPLLAVLLSCEGNKAPPVDSSAVAAPAPTAPTVAVHILAPAEGDTTGPDVTVVLAKEGVMIERASGTKVEGVGHHHLFLDTLATEEGAVIPPTTGRVVHIGTGDTTYTFKGLAPGAHEIVAVIGFGDHAAMPARRDTVRFVVRR